MQPRWMIIAALGVGMLLVATFVVVNRKGSSPAEKLMRQLKDPDDDVRAAAAKALGELGPEAKTAGTALAEALKDSDAKVRYQALKALTKIGIAEPSAVPSLMEMLKHSEPQRSLLCGQGPLPCRPPGVAGHCRPDAIPGG